MTKKRWTVGDKAKIVESHHVRRHRRHMQKVRPVAQHVLPLAGEVHGGKAALAGSPGARTMKAVQNTLKTLVGEITLANDLLKKRWKE